MWSETFRRWHQFAGHRFVYQSVSPSGKGCDVLGTTAPFLLGGWRTKRLSDVPARASKVRSDGRFTLIQNLTILATVF